MQDTMNFKIRTSDSIQYGSKLSDLRSYYSAALSLRAVEDMKLYEQVLRKIEKMFKKVTEENGVKKMGSFVYSPNGILVNDSMIPVILSPWEPTTTAEPIIQESKTFTLESLFKNKWFNSLIKSRFPGGTYLFYDSIKRDDFFASFVYRNQNTGMSYEIYELFRDLCLFKKLKDSGEENVPLNLIVNDSNYKKVILIICYSLLCLLNCKNRNGNFYYFPKESAKSIKKEVDLLNKTFLVHEAVDIIFKKIKDVKIDHFYISELKEMKLTLEKIMSEIKVNNDTVHRFRIMNRIWVDIINLSLSDLENFDRLFELFDTVYRKLCLESKRSEFVEWFCYSRGIISNNFLIYPTETKE